MGVRVGRKKQFTGEVMKIQIEERDRALKLEGIDLWLQQVQRAHYKPEYWTREKAAALALERAEYGFNIGYQAAKMEQKEGDK